MKLDFAKTIAITAALLLMLTAIGTAQESTFVKFVMPGDVWEVSTTPTIDVEVYVYSTDSVGGASVGLKIKPEYTKLFTIENATVGPEMCTGSFANIQNNLERNVGGNTDTIDVVLFGGTYFPTICPRGLWPRQDTTLIGTITFGFEDTLTNSSILDDSLEFFLDSAFVPPAGDWTFTTRVGLNMVIDTLFKDTIYIKNLVNVKEVKQGTLPENFTLGNNYPNPFNPTTNIEFALPKKAHVRLDVYNMLGQKVRTLVDKELEAGFKVVTWDGKDDSGSEVASGVYLYKMDAGNFSQSKKMSLVK